MTIELPALPYARDALEPFISRETIDFHYGKHHQGYVNKLNAAIDGNDWQHRTLEEIVLYSEGSMYNNAAQIWNHSFYWNCLSPKTGLQAAGSLLVAIESAFGSVAEFHNEFCASAAKNFGSGWTWLVSDEGGRLSIVNTSNADTPLRRAGLRALLTVDVWEHAYYLDYQNARKTYLQNFCDHINWEFVQQNFEQESA